jgi:hypothetical protein
LRDHRRHSFAQRRIDLKKVCGYLTVCLENMDVDHRVDIRSRFARAMPTAMCSRSISNGTSAAMQRVNVVVR